VPRVSLDNDHGVNGAYGSYGPRKHGIQNALELRGHLTEGVLVLARNRKDRIFLSPDDAIPEYNLISNL
jgi:hypothetical protein